MTFVGASGRRFLVFIGYGALACSAELVVFSRDAGEPIPPAVSTSVSSASVGMGGGFGSTIGTATIGPPTMTTTGGGGFAGAGGMGGGSVPGVSYCKMPYAVPAWATTDLISDFEGSTGLSIQTLTPSGTWIVETDGSGTDTNLLEPCGTNGIGWHLSGHGNTIWGADVAATFVSQVQPVNVSAYHGLTFVARSAAPTPLIVKLEAPYGQPACGLCDDTVAGLECRSGYIVTTTTTTTNQAQTVSWSSFFQQSWGARAPSTSQFDPANLVTLSFAFDKGVDFDVCLDDIRLLP